MKNSEGLHLDRDWILCPVCSNKTRLNSSVVYHRGSERDGGND